MISHLGPRNRDVISRRFGLKTGKKETLESIGASYGITRERVRQIEESSLKMMRDGIKLGGGTKLQPFLAVARQIISDHGGAVLESELFERFSGSGRENQINSALIFVLTLDGSHVRHIEDDKFHTFWSLDEKDRERLTNSVASLVGAFEKRSDSVKADSMLDFARNDAGLGDMNPAALNSYLAISKKIDRNVFNEVGLSSWAAIRPRGVRDKSFLVLKKENKPQHFRDIANLINKAGFSDRKAHVQTVHNELIKDDRFVLVGRGMYGLREWGFEPGTVKDVIVSLLKSKGPLAREEIVSHVMSSRFVKPNTVLLSMQDKSLFEEENGRLKLKAI